LGQPEAFSVSKGLLKNAPGFRPLSSLKDRPDPQIVIFPKIILIPGRFIVCKSESPSNNKGNPITKLNPKIKS
jgi:hypothetical protein